MCPWLVFVCFYKKFFLKRVKISPTNYLYFFLSAKYKQFHVRIHWTWIDKIQFIFFSFWKQVYEFIQINLKKREGKKENHIKINKEVIVSVEKQEPFVLDLVNSRPLHLKRTNNWSKSLHNENQSKRSFFD